MLRINAGRTEGIKVAEEAMGFKADTAISLLGEPKTPNSREGGREYQRHIAIEWEGGVLWLNMFDFVNYPDAESPHFCIDVRQFNSAGKVKGEGVFTMARNMQRGEIKAEAITGTVPQGHKYDGGFVVCILTDPDGKETHTDDER